MSTAIEQTLLRSRDIRANTVRRYKEKAETVVVLTVNMPGPSKNTPHGTYLLRQFTKTVCDMIDVSALHRHESDAGDYVVFETKTAAKAIKTQCLAIESTKALGRFIDLDVHTKNGVLTRAMLGVPERRCYVCNDIARQCARLGKHRVESLRSVLREHVEAAIAASLEHMVTDALRRELELSPKFGLVCLDDAGAHTDMDATHFRASIDVLGPYFRAFAAAGFDANFSMPALRELGKRAEVAMLDATGGVNTHKGAIFCFGAMLPYAAYGVLHGDGLETIINKVASSIQSLVEADFEAVMHEGPQTAGEHIYKTYGFKGIRAEVAAGFKSIFAWYPDKNPYRALASIVARAEDTTVINRHGIGMLRELQQDMRALLENKPFNEHLYKVLSEKYKTAGVSPGGAADLLAVSFFFDRLSEVL